MGVKMDLTNKKEGASNKREATDGTPEWWAALEKTVASPERPEEPGPESKLEPGTTRDGAGLGGTRHRTVEGEMKREHRYALLRGIDAAMKEEAEQKIELERKEEKRRLKRKWRLELDQWSIKKTTGKITKPFGMIQNGSNLLRGPFYLRGQGEEWQRTQEEIHALRMQEVQREAIDAASIRVKAEGRYGLLGVYPETSRPPRTIKKEITKKGAASWHHPQPPGGANPKEGCCGVCGSRHGS